MIEFRITEHDVTAGAQLVEVLCDGVLLGAIYGKEDGLLLYSKHFKGLTVNNDTGETSFDGKAITGVYVKLT